MDEFFYEVLCSLRAACTNRVAQSTTKSIIIRLNLRAGHKIEKYVQLYS